MPKSVSDGIFGTSAVINPISICGNFTPTLYLGCFIVIDMLLTMFGVGTSSDFTCGICKSFYINDLRVKW